jgi:integrase
MGNKKSAPKAKEPVRIRFKELKGGNKSIYFDIYRNGQRVYEFPKMYIVPEKSDTDRYLNQETMKIANQIKAQKILELASLENGLLSTGLKQKANFIDYIREIGEKRQEEYLKLCAAKNRKQNPNRGVIHNYTGLIRHLTIYRGNRVTFKHINREYCTGFNEYLKTAENGTYRQGTSETFASGFLSQGSQCNYSRFLSVVLNCAVQDGIIPANPMKTLSRFERPKQPESNREFLTKEEVMLLMKTECLKPIVKQSFLFTCLTGLRFSDVKLLKWGDFVTDNDGKKTIRYMQQKTGKHEVLQVSGDALQYLPDRNGARDGDIIFKLSTNANTNLILRSWALGAGIKKRVTFHAGRHTNATLLLSVDVAMETVSKMMGHSNIKTTQIYAKVIDKKKREAADKLGSLFSEMTANA